MQHNTVTQLEIFFPIWICFYCVHFYNYFLIRSTFSFLNAKKVWLGSTLHLLCPVKLGRGMFTASSGTTSREMRLLLQLWEAVVPCCLQVTYSMLPTNPIQFSASWASQRLCWQHKPGSNHHSIFFSANAQSRKLLLKELQQPCLLPTNRAHLGRKMSYIHKACLILFFSV